jgi:ribosomal protein S18 acetylase RimI-like enzyme
MIELRRATLEDAPTVLARSRALNAHEGITISDGELDHALRCLLGAPELGGVWLIERAGAVLGYAIVSFGYDLEFAGRDAYLTELWVDPEYRSGGIGAAALARLVPTSEPGSSRRRAWS